MSEVTVEQSLQIAEQLQAQLGLLEQQYEQLQAYVLELQRTRKAIDQLAAAPPTDDVLVPLGAGTFVRAKLGRVERVLAPIGAGVLAEEAPPAVGKRLEERETEARRASEQINQNMARMESQLAGLMQALHEAERTAGAAPG